MKDRDPIELGTLSRDQLKQHLDTDFRIETENGETVILTLLETLNSKDHRPENQRTGRAPFSAVFGCPDVPLPQGTYQLKHDALGSLVIFMTPFETYENGHKLEAVFS